MNGMPDLYLLEAMLSDEERGIRERVRTFCDVEVLPVINDYWQREEFPSDLVPKIAELGIAGGSISGHGCPGLSPVAEGLAAAEIARADGGLRVFLLAHSAAMLTIAALGSDDQRRRWLPSMARLEAVAGFAMTEPNHGSDVAGLETRARRDGDRYVLEGAKRWSGNATIADVLLVWARDDDGNVGAFLVEPPSEGLEIRPITGKIACRTAAHGDLDLDGVRVHADQRLVGARSFADAGRALAESRGWVAWEALGHAVAAYEIAVGYASEREQFGRPLGGFQLVQQKLAGMLVDVSTTQLMCWRLSRLAEEGRATASMASAAKQHAAAAARRVVRSARDLLGGEGLLLHRHLARHLADVEAVYTYEGTHDIHTLLLGREITGLSAFKG